MDISYNIPAFSILFSMFCAIIMLALKPRAALLLFRIEIALIAAGSCVLLFHFLNGAPAFTYSMGHFGAPFGNELRAGALEAGMALLVAVVITLSLNGGSLHLKADIIIEKQNLYYISLSLLTCSMMALIYTNDLFTAYVFIEINTITACAMVMSKRDVHTLSATITYLIMSLIGSGLFLLSICMLYGITGHLLMTPIQETIAQIPANSPYMRPLYGAMAMFAVGIGLKSAMWPFSFWLPEAHASASTTSSAILSGLVLKVYIFTLVKVYFRVIGINVVLSSGIYNILFVFGCLSMIVGSLGAIRCKDIKRMLAHSSIAQIGYVFCALGIG
ncbi:MAG: sodium:proton antiporter, partial [Firmicutes bacterium]|nr:sodium:proton antiporter [Bacillota bacterium]